MKQLKGFRVKANIKSIELFVTYKIGTFEVTKHEKIQFYIYIT